MKKLKSKDYLKVVEWSEADRCYVGTAPGLIVGGVHGRDQARVFDELCQLVEEAIELLEQAGRPLPEATQRDYSGKILLRISPDLHKTLAIRALQQGESLNRFVQHRLEASL